MAKTSNKAQEKIAEVMQEFKEGDLHSGSQDGPVVKSRKQAIAIALNEAKQAGLKVPKKPQNEKAKKGEASAESPKKN